MKCNSINVITQQLALRVASMLNEIQVDDHRFVRDMMAVMCIGVVRKDEQRGYEELFCNSPAKTRQSQPRTSHARVLVSCHYHFTTCHYFSNSRDKYPSPSEAKSVLVTETRVGLQKKQVENANYARTWNETKAVWGSETAFVRFPYPLKTTCLCCPRVNKLKMR